MRCIYSERALTPDEKKIFESIEDEMNYTCGSPFVPENHDLYNKVFVREKITCETPIELAYYSSMSRRQGLKQLCYWCGVDGGLVDSPEILTAKYKFVFPCCTWCLENGKKHFCRVEIKTNSKRQRRK